MPEDFPVYPVILVVRRALAASRDMRLGLFL